MASPEQDNDSAWYEFIRLLEEPVRPDPRLVELFNRPQRIKRNP